MRRCARGLGFRRERRGGPATPAPAPEWRALARREGHLFSSRLLELDGFLCLRHAVHQHHRDCETRDERLAVAAIPTRVHDLDRLRDESPRLPDRHSPRVLENRIEDHSKVTLPSSEKTGFA